ncbi:MAG: peroxiredoxin-like family protein [Akkermansiaceae bacterium]
MSLNAETLEDRLKARAAQGSDKITPEIKAAFADGIEAVKKAKIVETAKQVGDTAPDFTLKNASGKEVKLSEQLKQGPVVLTWYRGGWCPYCNIALAALQEELPAIKKAGASLMALTPELPDKALSTTEKNKLKFQVLTDLNHKAADKYGLIFKLTREVEKLYGKFFDLKEFNGKEAGTDTLPLAATYIIGTDGKIKWAYLDHDYRKRAEPKDIVKFLEGIKK